MLLLHGPFFGAGDLPAERALARELGLDIIAPERPGYGRTEPPLSYQNALDAQVDDTLAVLDALGFEQFKILSQDIALVPALQLCQRIPERVISLTAASAPAPFKEMEQITGMPGKQRMFIWATRHANWLVRLLIRLGMVQMRRLGPQRWMEGVFGDVPNEMAVLNTP
ncbi:MAG: alpha/beta fold hydrolase, partial [Venatoribacter sp.]